MCFSKQMTTCILLIFSNFPLLAQVGLYKEAYSDLKKLLSDKEKLSLKEAVFIIENTYMDGVLPKEKYETKIEKLKTLVHILQQSRDLQYDHKDKEKVEKSAALYTLLTDTVSIALGEDTLYHTPYSYGFGDPFGEGDWKNMFVTKLLSTKKGNCHSLPYLYKILADEIGVEAHLALAPNHIYIKQRCEKTGWYNTELTSASFPIDAWIMASGYVCLEAIQNGIYMKALSDEETIAICVVDLAMGYDRKFPGNDGSFILKCCELALQHFPNFITAVLLKAETKQRLIRQMMGEHGVGQPEEIFPLAKNSKALWEEMERDYFHAHQLGYRQMPKQMYLDWLGSLHEEGDKYNNKKVVKFGKKD